MTLKNGDRLKETSTTTGTGAFTLAGAVANYRAFSAICANADTIYYCIDGGATGEWETGLGTWGTGGVLTRTTPIAGSAATPVSFSAGTKTVYCSIVQNSFGMLAGLNNWTGVNLFGTASADINIDGGPTILQIATSSNTPWFATFKLYAASAAGPSMVFSKSRGVTATAFTAVVADDRLADWWYYGSDGSADQLAAYFAVVVAGAVSAGVVPTKFEFYTTNTAGVRALRYTFGPFGELGVGSPAAYGSAGDVLESAGSAAAPAWTKRANVITATPNSNQNNYAPSGYSGSTQREQVARLNIGATMKLTGWSAGVDGMRLTIKNVSTDYLLWLEHQNTNSSAANRFRLPKAFPAFLMPGDSIVLEYDGTDSRWDVVEWPNQGPAMGLSEFSDMGGRNPSSSGQALGPWSCTFSGTGAGTAANPTYGVDSTEKAQGVTVLSAGTTTTGRGYIGQAGTAQCIFGQGPALAVSRVALEAAVDGTQTYTIHCGFVDEYAGVVTDGVYWEYRWTGAAAEWSQNKAIATAVTRSNSGSPTPNTAYQWCVVFINAAGNRADMIYSQDSTNFLVASSISTLPTAGTSFCAAAILKSAGTTARVVDIDLAGCRFDNARG